MTVGAVTGAMLMLIRLRGPLMGLMRVLDTIQSGYASLARIAGVVVNPPQPTKPAGAPPKKATWKSTMSHFPMAKAGQ